MTSGPSTGTATVTLPADDEILIMREFDAPRRLVYRAWTTPELVKRWWSGGMGEMTAVEIDLRVGGWWRFVMLAEGQQVAFHGEYREIVPDERLVNTEVYEMPGSDGVEDTPPALNVVTFEDLGERTLLRLLVQTSDKDMRDAILHSGMEEGMQRQYDMLEQVVSSLR